MNKNQQHHTLQELMLQRQFVSDCITRLDKKAETLFNLYFDALSDTTKKELLKLYTQVISPVITPDSDEPEGYEDCSVNFTYESITYEIELASCVYKAKQKTIDRMSELIKGAGKVKIGNLSVRY